MIYNVFFSTKSRRGISSVVGSLIFTVLMIAGFSAMGLALDSQTDIVNTQRVVSDIELKKQQEQFGISVSTDTNNILSVLVDNGGQNPVEISRVWLTNKTLPTQPVTPYSVNSNDAFIPTGFESDVLSTQPLYLVPDTYDVKVISSLGTVRTAELAMGFGPFSSGLSTELYVISPDVIMGENATIVMHVTNEGDLAVTNVTPDNDPPISDNPSWISTSQLVSPSSIDLDPSESGIFVWNTKLSTTGTVNNKLMFSNSASGIESVSSNTIQSNIDSDKITLRTHDGGGPFGGPGESTGNIVMEFSSFEFCEPAVDDCRSNSSDWITAWDGKTSTEYIWRINIANIGPEDILLEQTTSLFMLHAQTQGGGNLPRVFFIKADSTPTNEDPGAYVDYSKIIPKDGTPVLLYFGVSTNGGSSLQDTHSAAGINAAFLLIFGHQDLDDSGTFNSGDIPYSQNLAYQGLRLN